MGLFSQIRDRIFGHPKAKAPASGRPADPAVTASASSGSAHAAPAATPAQTRPQTQASPSVDVGAVLAAMAEMQGGGGNYQTSIVDLLKLLHLDSSLDARKELAAQLGVDAGPHGSAEQNVALHRAVMKKLQENGAQVPDSFYR